MIVLSFVGVAMVGKLEARQPNTAGSLISAAIMVLAFVLGVSVTFISPAEDDSSDHEIELNDSQDLEEPNVEETEPNNLEQIELLQIGQTATIGEWEINITSVDFVHEIQSSDFFYYAPDDGSVYAYIVLTARNTGTSPNRFLESIPAFGQESVRSEVMYDNEFTFINTLFLTYRDGIIDTTVNPLTSTTGSLVYTVPEVVVDSSAPLTLSFSYGQETVSFDLKSGAYAAHSGIARNGEPPGEFNYLTISEFEEQYNAVLSALGAPTVTLGDAWEDSVYGWDASNETLGQFYFYGEGFGIYVNTEAGFTVKSLHLVTDINEIDHALAYYHAAVLVLEGWDESDSGLVLDQILRMEELNDYDNGVGIRRFIESPEVDGVVLDEMIRVYVIESSQHIARAGWEH